MEAGLVGYSSPSSIARNLFERGARRAWLGRYLRLAR